MRVAKRLGVQSWLLLGAALALAVGCSGSDDDGGADGSGGGGGDGGQDQPAEIPEFVGVFGYVYGPTGAAVPGASVLAEGVTGSTDASGYFELELSASGTVVVRATADGHLPGLKSVPVGGENPSALEFRLIAEAAPLPLDATMGGEVTGDRGASMTAPPSAFVNSAGETVTDEVMVHLTPLDPSVPAELAAYPGDLSATAQDGTQVHLETFGVLDVTVRAGDERLDVADGQTLTIRIPAPQGGPEPPATIPLWSFNEETGLWVEEGTATLDVATNTYVGEIGHMSFWNCDQPQSSTCISGRVVDRTETPVPGAYVTSTGMDYNGSSSATTDENGEFCMLVRRNSQVSVSAMHPAGGGEIKEITSGETPAEPPLTCSPACQDIGTFTIEAGTVVGPGGESYDCDGVPNPWLNTCAADFGGIIDCFRPVGACTYSLDGTVTWENGSRTEVDIQSARNGTPKGALYGPGDELCATYTVVQGDDSSFTITYTLANGQTFSIATTGDSADTVITCPGGEQVTVTQEEQQLYEACVGAGSETDQCTLDTSGGGGGGELPGGCEDNSDCDSGQTCCDFGSGIKICAPEGACPQ